MEVGAPAFSDTSPESLGPVWVSEEIQGCPWPWHTFLIVVWGTGSKYSKWATNEVSPFMLAVAHWENPLQRDSPGACICTPIQGMYLQVGIRVPSSLLADMPWGDPLQGIHPHPNIGGMSASRGFPHLHEHPKSEGRNQHHL